MQYLMKANIKPKRSATFILHLFCIDLLVQYNIIAINTLKHKRDQVSFFELSPFHYWNKSTGRILR